LIRYGKNFLKNFFIQINFVSLYSSATVAKQVDARDLKSLGQ
jgi:hypothetical protein